MSERTISRGDARKTLCATGGMVGALAMTSCCVLPLTLFSLGVTGAWIGSLSGLYEYRWIFFVVTAGFLGGGFYLVYGRRRAVERAGQGSCGTPVSERVNKAALWTATVLAAAAISFPYLAPEFLA